MQNNISFNLRQNFRVRDIKWWIIRQLLVEPKTKLKVKAIKILFGQVIIKRPNNQNCGELHNQFIINWRPKPNKIISANFDGTKTKWANLIQLLLVVKSKFRNCIFISLIFNIDANIFYKFATVSPNSHLELKSIWIQIYENLIKFIN